MITNIDKVGRIVIPKALRQAAGLSSGPVDVVVEGAGIRIEPVSGSGVASRDGRLVIESTIQLDDDEVRRLRFANQR